jgi:protein tyrosine phosphatase
MNYNWITRSVSWYVYSFLNKINPYTYNSMSAISQKVYVDNGAEVHSGVYIGSLSTATNSAWIQDNEIDIIFNLSGYVYKSIAPQIIINMEDEYVNIDAITPYMEKFLKAAKAVKKCRRDGKKILVHCAAGINRSATVICFYLMMCGHSYNEAVDLITNANTARGTAALTNISFRYLLKTYESCRMFA